jgi:hypothetical protein
LGHLLDEVVDAALMLHEHESRKRAR